MRRIVTKRWTAVVAGAVLLAAGGATRSGAAETPPASAPAAAPKDAGAKDAAAAKPVAMVADAPVTAGELDADAAGELATLEHQYQASLYQIRESHLQRLVRARLLAAEAKARGTTEDKVLASIQPVPVSDKEVGDFYDQNQARIGQPKEKVAAEIQKYLEQERQVEARDAFFSGLEKRYGVKILLEPLRVAVAADGPARGRADAPVTIVEFSDFQCPYCGRLEPTLAAVRARYGDKVRIVYRQFPLPMHPNAEKAAEASLCADAQGKFWEMHDAMFANQEALSVDALKATAGKLGLDAAAFAACLDSGKFAARIREDVADGDGLGVAGTPAMFINGRMLDGAVPIDDIAKVIDDELARRSGP